jgi:hypothetical protein
MLEQVDEIRKLLCVKEVSALLGCTDWLTRQLIYRGGACEHEGWQAGAHPSGGPGAVSQEEQAAR